MICGFGKVSLIMEAFGKANLKKNTFPPKFMLSSLPQDNLVIKIKKLSGFIHGKKYPPNHFSTAGCQGCQIIANYADPHKMP
jgi:hypothetical protein